jgi:hypothetical protein
VKSRNGNSAQKSRRELSKQEKRLLKEARRAGKKAAATTAVLILLLTVMARSSFADNPISAPIACTVTGTVPADTSTTLLPGAPSSCRNFVLIQNSSTQIDAPGADYDLHIAIGNGITAGPTDFRLAPGGSLMMRSPVTSDGRGCHIPGNEIDGYSVNGTTFFDLRVLNTQFKVCPFSSRAIKCHIIFDNMSHTVLRCRAWRYDRDLQAQGLARAFSQWP